MRPNPQIHTFLLRGTVALAALFLLAACGSAPVHSNGTRADTSDWADADDREGDDSFENASLSDDDADDDEPFDVASISEDTLSEMRGGFVTSGGFQINFGLESSTSVNGIVQSSLNVSSNNLHGTLPQSLQQLIQISGNGQVSASSPMILSNSVLTLVQNNANNTLITNTNTLTLSVSNLASYRNQIAVLNSIIPMVRALH